MIGREYTHNVPNYINRVNPYFRDIMSMYLSSLRRFDATRNLGKEHYMICERRPTSLKDMVYEGKDSTTFHLNLRGVTDYTPANMTVGSPTQGQLSTYTAIRFIIS